MSTALTLYNNLVARGAQPALTWYSHTQGRMELSGSVCANHLSKIAGFLSDEIWSEPGQTISLELPCHWKSLLWSLGSMLAGLTVDIAGSDDAPLLVTHKPHEAASINNARDIIALDMNPLSFGWTGHELPDGVLDGSAGQLSYPDYLADTTRHAASNFETWLIDMPDVKRALLCTTSFETVLRTACTQFLRGGSLVVTDSQADERAHTECAHIISSCQTE